WFGDGFGEFAVAAPDTWPRARRAGIPLTTWWRRTALAWVLQSPELTRAETDGLVLLWRRDVAERLARLAPFARFDVPVPLVADGALWWIAYGYVGVEAFPLARPVEWQGRGVRYLRADFLGAVSAATGKTLLYLAPGGDSLAQAWARRYAPLVRPLDSLPPSLRAQLPYPRLAFRTAATQVTRSRADTASWTPRPREQFELVAPSPAAGGAGEGPTPAQALRDLLATGASRASRDTSLAARWEAARRLVAQADSALAAGDMEAFGRLYDALKQLLGVARRKLAPPPGPR